MILALKLVFLVFLASAFVRGWGIRAVTIAIIPATAWLIGWLAVSDPVHRSSAYFALQTGLDGLTIIILGLMTWRAPEQTSPVVIRIRSWIRARFELVANNLYAKAVVFRDQERYAEAIPLLDAMRSIISALRGPQSEEYLTQTHNLAACYARIGDVRQAESLFCQVINESNQGSGSRADALYELGSLYESEQKYGDAASAYTRALEVLRPAPEERIQLFLSSLCGLGRLHYSRSPNGAPAIYSAAVALLNSSGRKDELFRLMHNWAEVCQKAGAYADAERVLREAVERSRTIGGLTLAQTLGQLGKLLETLGRDTEAKPIIDECVELARQDPQLSAKADREINEILKRLDAARSVGLELFQQGRLDEAFQHQKEVMALARRSAKRPMFASLLVQNADLFSTVDRFAEAEVFYQEAADILRTMSPGADLHLECLIGFAQALKRLGRSEEAEVLYREALASFGPSRSDRPEIETALWYGLAAALAEIGRAEEAEQARLQAALLRRHSVGN